MSKFELKQMKSRALGTSLGAAFLLAATSASAATITVDALTDSGAVDGNCELRDAVTAANTNAAVDGCTAGDAGADIINFAGPGTYVLGAAGELAITEAVSFNESAQLPTIDAQNNGRIFNNSAALTLTDMTLINGLADGAGNPANSGGAILNNVGGTVTATGGAMNNNTALRAGGAIEDASNAATAVTLTNVNFSGNNAGGDTPAPGNGGVLHVSGTGGVSITGGSQDSNIAANEGGAQWNGGGTMTVINVSFTGNSANGADASEGGGALFNEGGVLTITDSTITGNSATGSAADPAVQGSGGGILNNSGDLTVTNSTISGNSSVRAGGGIEADARELDNTASTTLNNVTMDANTTGGSPGNGGALHVSGGGNVTEVNGGTFSNNIAANEGGGLWNFGAGATMTIDGATVITNQGNGTDAANGGGGLFNNGGVMNVLNTTVDSNTAVMGSGSGGGILNAGAGTLSVTSSSIVRNTANRAGGGIESGSPGTAGSSVTLDDVFLSANTVNTSPGNGGGLHAGTDGDVDVTNSIVSNNNAGLEGGGLWVNNGTLNITASRISGNNGLGDRATNATSGNADGGGGGIVMNGTGTLNVTANSLISQNIASGNAGSGGGIFIKPGSTANVTDSVIAANSSSRAGGGIENDGGTVTLLRVTLGGADSSTGNIAGTSPGNGGGLHTGGAGTVTVEDSSVSFNTAAEGGGLWNSGAGTLTVNNTTVSNNQATVRTGGGVHQDSDAANGVTTLNFATVTQNNAAAGGSGVAIEANDGGISAASAESSIIANNVGDNTNAGVTTDNSVVDVDPGLGDLQLFGGSTATHRVLAGSMALDTGDAVTCAAPPIGSADQRAATRPAACDAGAFEAADNPVVTVTNNSQGSVSVPAGGATGVTVLAFTLANNSGADVTINGVSGVVDANVPGLDPSNFQVFANGSTTPLAGAAVTVDGRSFTVTFNGVTGAAFADGDSVPYTVTADFGTDNLASVATIGTPVFAGGLLLSLLGLFSVGGVRRRTQWGLLVLAMTVGLTACGSSGSGGGIFEFGDNNANADLRFVAVTVDGNAGVGNDFIVGDGMPAAGPGINFSN